MGRMADVAEFLTRSGYGSVRQQWRRRQGNLLLCGGGASSLEGPNGAACQAGVAGSLSAPHAL